MTDLFDQFSAKVLSTSPTKQLCDLGVVYFDSFRYWDIVNLDIGQVSKK